MQDVRLWTETRNNIREEGFKSYRVILCMVSTVKSCLFHDQVFSAPKVEDKRVNKSIGSFFFISKKQLLHGLITQCIIFVWHEINKSYKTIILIT